MTHSYQIEGMTCGGCKNTVAKLLSGINGVKNVNVDIQNKSVAIEMKEHIPFLTLKNTLELNSKFRISEIENLQPKDETGESKTWISTYRPLLLVFGYITLASLIPEFKEFNWMRWMNHFMGAFFLAFSFFKVLDLKGFAESYSMYDVIAKKWRNWGFIYPFIELALAIAFLTGLVPLATNAITFVVMSISLIGVVQSVLNKRKIRCACLGAVFNLPMSTVTIIEDLLMIGMSAIMVLTMI